MREDGNNRIHAGERMERGKYRAIEREKIGRRVRWNIDGMIWQLGSNLLYSFVTNLTELREPFKGENLLT